MSDSDSCPTSHCGRPMRGGSLVCRRCWYVVPDDLKQAYRSAREALKHHRTARNIEWLLALKKAILDSVNPKGSPP